MEGKADQKLWLRQVNVVKGIDVGDQLFNQGEAFRGDKILQIGDRDALVVDGRGTGDEEQGQLVDLGLVVFDPEILLDLARDVPRQLILVGADGGMSRISSVLTLRLRIRSMAMVMCSTRLIRE